MTVKELRAHLAQFPGDMEVLETRYSDFSPMALDSWGLIDGIPQVSGRYGWVQRADQLTDEHRSKMKTYLHYAGN